jgi:small subunit ribosomal protein S7
MAEQPGKDSQDVNTNVDANANANAAGQAEQRPKTRRTTARKASVQKPSASIFTSKERLLFGKYSYDVIVSDPSLRNYISLNPVEYPMSFRRGSQKMFSKASINIVERLENSLLRGGTGGKISGRVIRTKGRLQGKKLKVMHSVEKAFDKIYKETDTNPLQILVRALENSAPIEDTTRVRYGGIISNVAVDVSASRRLDIALRNIAMAAVLGSFGSKRTFVDSLANELVLASRMDLNSYAIKRKNEIERMARSAK